MEYSFVVVVWTMSTLHDCGGSPGRTTITEAPQRGAVSLIGVCRIRTLLLLLFCTEQKGRSCRFFAKKYLNANPSIAHIDTDYPVDKAFADDDKDDIVIV